MSLDLILFILSLFPSTEAMMTLTCSVLLSYGFVAKLGDAFNGSCYSQER